MGSDGWPPTPPKATINFNPRSPDGERHSALYALCVIEAFQSTLPGWGATFQIVRTAECFTYFNPRSPDGERPRFTMKTTARSYFNPRSPDGERRVVNNGGALAIALQSTLPGWGATGHLIDNGYVNKISIHAPRRGSDFPSWRGDHHRQISIHAPRMGSDSLNQSLAISQDHFNPRSPDGERLLISW